MAARRWSSFTFSPSFRGDAHYGALHAGPELAVGRRRERKDMRIRQAFLRPEVRETPSLVARKARVGAEPKATSRVLGDGVDHAAREAVLRRQPRPPLAIEARRAAAPGAGPDRAVARRMHGEHVVLALGVGGADAVRFRPRAPGLAVVHRDAAFGAEPRASLRINGDRVHP